MSGVPIPVTSLMASIAIAEPTVPTTGPNTPAAAHDGTVPGAGGVGKTSSKSGPWPAQKTDSCASKPRMDAHTWGIPARAHAHEVR